jgi:hypothetical protein
MQNLKSLDEFKDIAQRYHSAYHMAHLGLVCLAEKISSEDGYNPANSFVIRDTKSDSVISALPYFHLMKGMRKDGPISQVIAHGIINWIYAAWDERFRKRIAEELGVNCNEVMCDVMGDIRIIRNAISHDLGFATEKISELKELSWFSPGQIILRSDDMNKIQVKINSMSVYVSSGKQKCT